MRTIYSPLHEGHSPSHEFAMGVMLPVWEKPARAQMILDRVREVALGPVDAPSAWDRRHLLAVHDPAFVDFLEGIHDEWVAAGRLPAAAIPFTWAGRQMHQDRVPEHMDGRMSYYSFDTATPIVEGTWKAAVASAETALTATQGVVDGASVAFALCRPPGHHAGKDQYGGFCLLNNAAIAAQLLREKGCARVAIIDVDYHHGNGTQTIFYDRPDVLFTSIHADPRTDYPFHLGYADETGAGAGEGFNLNLPLGAGSAFDVWGDALETACRRVEAFGADAIVVSLGVDTYENDPISLFKLKSADYLRVGERLKRLGKPTVFIMEGGYAIEAIGINAVNVLSGFEGA